MFFCVIVSLILMCTGRVHAHPSIGILLDSKGNIYYSDLDHVWKVSNGKKTIAVSNVHTHELFIDANDNIFGEHLWYAGDASGKFFHYYWRLNRDGKLDTIISQRQAFTQVDFSLALDESGNQYYCKFTDSMHLYKRNANGEERLFATHDFKGVKFFQVQQNGDIYFTQKNNLYHIPADGKTSILAGNVGSQKSMLWGVWQDTAMRVYIAAFGDKVIHKIERNGKAVAYYRSSRGWAPANGVFDKKNRLWILEWSDKNEVRVVMMGSEPEAKKKSMLLPVSVGVTVILAMIVGLVSRKDATKRFHAKTQRKVSRKDAKV